MNGLTRGGLQNHFPNFNFQGCRTLETVFASESLEKFFLIQYLSVQDLNHFKDHKLTLLKYQMTISNAEIRIQGIALQNTGHLNISGKNCLKKKL